MILIRYTILLLSLCFLGIAQTVHAQCTTNAGTISGGGLLCAGDFFSINNMGNETLDSNDVLIFVAYTGDNPNATTVFATSTTVNFSYQSSFLANSPFKVAAVAGNASGGTVDWDDPCLSVSPPLTITYTAPPVVAAAGGGTLNCINTSLTIAVTVDQPNCFFQWSNGATGLLITVQQPGLYCVTVTNQAGCTASTCVTVLVDATLPEIIVTPPPPLSCTSPAIVLNSISSCQQCQYAWIGPGGYTSTVENPVIVQPGTYTVIVTDPSNGCTSTAAVTVESDIVPPDANAGPDTGIPCGGGTVPLDGITSSTGVNFTYIWTGPGLLSGATTLNPVVEQPGIYTLLVTNANNGCTATDQVTVFPGPAIPQQDFVVTAATCTGINNGSINLTMSVGQGPFDFEWTGPAGFTANTEDINNLLGGQYTVVVTDGTGCSYYANVLVGQAAPMTLTPPQVTNASCFGGGEIAFSIIGGTPSYLIRYQWNGVNSIPFLTSNNQIAVNNLSGGVYLFTITDANGCMAVLPPVIITQPVALTVTADPINCGENSAQVSVTGGTPPYAYLWSNGSTAPIIHALTPGTYWVTVTDANGCSGSATVTIGSIGNPFCGLIIGKVFRDLLDNCTPDPNEQGLVNWIVQADGVSGNTFYGVTDTSGTYQISVEEGNYTLTLLPPNALWDPCTATLPLGAVAANETVIADDFLVKTISTCPALTVSIGTSLLRRCFSNNYYFIEYCNEGTAKAEDAFIIITLDPFLSPVSATLPYTNLGGNALRFNLGDIEVGECGAFNLRFQISCEAVLGQTHCTKAHIYPDSTCLPADPAWSGASLVVSSECDADSVRFTIQNVGVGDMIQATEYVIIEDAVMLMQAPVQLNSGAFASLSFPANGSTWRVEVEQVPFHPGNSQPSLSVEGCSENVAFSTGFVNQFPNNDADSWIDIDCTPNIGSYDPNDKQGFPVGYGAAHYVRPGTELEYLIRFQNTGTDTAFTVRVVDTLSSWLDPTTVRPGASSHEYQFNLTGLGVVEFLFENILLPDSNVNEPASNGFVKFSIKPKENTPLETVIENDAAIYFDFNDPVITNTTFHRLGENFLVGVWHPRVPDAEVSVSPNPFANEAILQVKGLRGNAPLQLRLMDLRGVVVQEMETSGTVFTLRKGDWPTGVYLFQILQEGRLVGSGKLVVK